MANRHMNRWSTLFITGKMQNYKYNKLYNYTFTRIAKNKMNDKTKCWWGCGDTGTLTHSWWECKNGTAI